MYTNEQTLQEIANCVGKELATLCKDVGADETAVEEIKLGITELVKSKGGSPHHTIRIDRYADQEIQRILDRSKFSSADFRNGTWVEIVANFKEEKVTIKTSSAQPKATVLYQRNRQAEPAG